MELHREQQLDPQFADEVAAIRRRLGERELISVRLAAASNAATHLKSAGQTMHVIGHLIGDGRVSGTSTRGNGDDALVGVAVLLQIAAELLDTSSELLCGTRHYAGAALLRQVVEVEYLTWAFANEERDAAAWLNSTHDERMRLFSPKRLRGVSDGRFRSEDYQHHCEQGGHPVPRAIPLLGQSDSSVAQMLMLDLMLHCWRITDNVLSWAERTELDGRTAGKLLATQQVFAQWGQEDPLYQWALSAPLAP
ncbi:hypothetical protein SAMN05892883_2209 [Jatrophihabitans sp. GAS493]|uniref:hypothetical protein n=1 Tax=Jatrophihabitans sp. GAS493 TaxID=1907575 RepID=UPI000BB7C57E|nr:hypothetical protein [Jatrophihabitans sp. GAS493]SOD72894.1 hypothetical protein SAMN05892883_2209 [Jatrophihabitans sp. GAS493]